MHSHSYKKHVSPPSTSASRPAKTNLSSPYHSNFDTFHWMNTTGDPGWNHHLATAKIWSLMAAQLAESPVPGFNATEYALELHRYVQVARQKLPDSINFDFSPLETSMAKFYAASVAFDVYASHISSLFHNTDSNSQSFSQNIHQLAPDTVISAKQSNVYSATETSNPARSNTDMSSTPDRPGIWIMMHYITSSITSNQGIGPLRR